MAKGDGSGDIFKVSATFKQEWDIPLVEAGDGIAGQYRAFWSYAMMAKARNEEKNYTEYRQSSGSCRK